MKQKTLFFIDGWFLHFGIAKYIQENSDMELYAVIDVEEKAKKFFQEQEIVKFKKFWFFMDNIQTNKKPDIEYLTSIEEKYKINLWNIAYSDKEFYQYNLIHQFTQEEILSLLEQECKLYEMVLEQVKPDYLSIMLTSAHHQELLCALCKAKGVKILMLGTTRLRNGMMISETGGILDNITSLDEYKSSMTVQEQEDYFSKYHASKEMDEYRISNFESQFFNRYVALLKFLFRPQTGSFKRRYWNYGRTRTKVLKNKLIHFLRKKYRGLFIDKCFQKIIDENKPFIYFPLQMEPERILLINAKYYTNQISVITNLAKSLPVGYTLYVKEHPIMSIWGWRHINFYKQIMELPNVCLIHPSVPTDEIIKKCSLVITIAGTAAQEAAFYNKPAIVFTDQIYCLLPSVYKVKSFDELPEAIKTSLKKNIDGTSLQKFIDLLKKETFEFPLVKITSDFTYRFGFKGLVMDAELPNEKVEKFLKDYETEFHKLGEEHMKKIEIHRKMKNS